MKMMKYGLLKFALCVAMLAALGVVGLTPAHAQFSYRYHNYPNWYGCHPVCAYCREYPKQTGHDAILYVLVTVRAAYEND
jgi:hypothetical protein